LTACQDVGQIVQKIPVGGAFLPGLAEFFNSHPAFSVGEMVSFYPAEVNRIKFLWHDPPSISDLRMGIADCFSRLYSLF
jgi:hypothetical protein